MKTIEIVVSPTGQTSVQTKGFAGAACREASCLLEEALGRRLTDQATAEYFQAVPLVQEEHERQG